MPSFSASAFAASACFLLRMKWKTTKFNRKPFWIFHWIDVQRKKSIASRTRTRIFIFSIESNILPYDIRIFVIFALGITPSAIHNRCIHICRWICVWFIQQWNYWQQNCSYILCWIPSFTWQFTALWIIYRRMQYRNAQITILKWNEKGQSMLFGGWEKINAIHILHRHLDAKLLSKILSMAANTDNPLEISCVPTEEKKDKNQFEFQLTLLTHKENYK